MASPQHDERDANLNVRRARRRRRYRRLRCKLAISSGAPVNSAVNADPRVASGQFDRASADLRQILAAPRLRLGQWPTPIDTVHLDGHRLLVKRDDLSGFGRGGAKTRKIEHVMGLMRAGGYDELITVIGNITNLGFDLIPALRAHGFSWRIFVQDDPPLARRLRAHAFRGIESDLRFLGKSRLVSTAHVALEWLRRRASGKRPFLLLPGAFHPAGVLGSAWGFIEMAEQCRAAGLPLPPTVFVSAATGTTIAGFLIAENALRGSGFDPVQIVGVQVYPGNIGWRTRLLLRWTERHLGLRDAVDVARIDIRHEALAGGFGRAGPELESLCNRIQARTGLYLDPIFGGKTWSVMQRAAKAETPSRSPPMFWHCGYTPRWKALVRSLNPPGGVDDAATATPPAASKRPLSKAAIIAAYVVAFYGALPVALWSFGGRLDQALQLAPAQGSAFEILGAVTLLTGFAIVLGSTALLVRIGKGLPISHLPPSRLVVAGPYRWMRHPHYVGYNLAFSGVGLIQASWGRSLGAGLLLLMGWLLYALVFEEPRLLRRYGTRYAHYRESVGILPLPSPVELFERLVASFRNPLEALANRVVLFRIGHSLWVTYGLFAALGAGLLGASLGWLTLGVGWTGWEAWRLVAVIAVATPVASRAAWFILPGNKAQASVREMLRRVGFVSWGGYAGAFAMAAWLADRAGVSPLRMLDFVMVPGFFAIAIARWGCHAYGCCIGRHAPWGVRWSHPDSWIQRMQPGPARRRIPTQLLSSLHDLLVGLSLVALSLRPAAPGALAAVGGLLYALPRFGIEQLREESRFGRWRLTVGQLGCIAMAVFSFVVLGLATGDATPFWPPALAWGRWPWVIACGGTALTTIWVAYGFHWKKIGQW